MSRTPILRSRTILVTGANNGIGLAMVQALLQMGNQVAAHDLRSERA